MDNLILLSLFLFQQPTRRNYFSLVKQKILSQTSQLNCETTGQSEYLLRNSSASFSLSIVDQLSCAECLVQV